MPKTKELCEATKAAILALLAIGMSERQVAKKLKVSKTAIHYTKKKQAQYGTTKLLAGRGRKRLSTPRDDRALIRSCVSNLCQTTRDLKNEWALSRNVTCSARTVRNRLLEAGLKLNRPRKEPFINERQREARLLFAGDHKDWTVDDWAKVLFSDESSFQLMPTPANLLFRRKPGEAYKQDCLAPTVKHGGGSVMIWGCFSLGGTGQVQLCEGRMNQVMYRATLENSLLPSAAKLFPASNDWIFQQDNTPCHTARSIKAWMENQNIQTMSWPAQSPDLNPIENLWKIIKRKMENHKPKNKANLFELVQQEWAAVTAEQCQKLVESMPRRMAAVIRNNGYVIKY
uniref:Tc1-like transposase DDE domain-containing protein n=1 Tax=Amphiprion ocellaris TaxID=80972 RepID=A0AAQ5XGI7_AMPOC